MLSSASSRADRFAAATGALLLQLGFLAAFLFAVPLQTPHRQIEHELTFFLPRLVPRIVPPRQPVETGPSATAPTILVPLPSLTAPLTAPPATAPSDLQNFGQALQGCAPETYSSLAPEQRARCPRPGDGVAIQQYPDPLHPPHPAKDEATWQEEFRRAHLAPPDCPPGVKLANCLIEWHLAEMKTEEIFDQQMADAKAKALKPPALPSPQHLGALPRASPESVGVHPQ